MVSDEEEDQLLPAVEDQAREEDRQEGNVGTTEMALEGTLKERQVLEAQPEESEVPERRIVFR